MYLLYLDESGNPDDASDKHFVLGGLAVFERTTFFLSSALDNIQAKYFPGIQPVEFHAGPIRAGRDFWRKVDKAIREQVIQDLLSAITTSHRSGVVLFAATVEKTSALYGEEAVKRATEQVCKRFDIFLQRHYHDDNVRERGLIVFAEGRFHQRSRVWVRDFRTLGTQWGILRNLSDIPYFASTRETRLLQAADLVAHSVYLAFEKGTADLLAPMVERFDQKNGVIHGLAHVTEQHVRALCECPACASKRVPGDYGPWARP